VKEIKHIWKIFIFYIFNIWTNFLDFIFKFSTIFQPQPSMSSLYLIGRLVSVAFGVSTVMVTALWGRLLWGSAAGLLTGVLMAMLYTPIENSHYATVDGGMAFWVVLTLFLLSLALLRPQDRYTLIAAAVTTGIAIGTKYTAMLLIIPLVTTAWLKTDSAKTMSRRKLYGLTVTLGVLTAAFLLAALVMLWKHSAILEWAANLTTDGKLESEYLALYQRLNFLLLIAGVGCAALLIGLRKFPNAHLWHWLSDPQWIVLLILMGLVFVGSSFYVLIEWRTAAQDFFYEYRHMQIGSAAHFLTSSPIYQSIRLKSMGALPSLTHLVAQLNDNLGTLGLILAVLGILPLWQQRRHIAYITIPFLIISCLLIASWGNWATRYALFLFPLMVVLLAGCWKAFYDFLKTREQPWSSLMIILLTFPILWLPFQHTRSAQAYFRLTDTRELAMPWVMANIEPGTQIAIDPYAPDFVFLGDTYKIITANPYVLVQFDPQTLDEENVLYVITTLPQENEANSAWVSPERLTSFNQRYQLVAEFTPSPRISKGRSIYIYNLSETTLP
jgi:4-amino-4-deoxy-L-arabinose transferase-like glycosyltransferase